MMHTAPFRILLAATCLIEAGPISFALGQAAPQRDPLQPPATAQPHDTPLPGNVPTQPHPDESLSDQLSRSSGVLHPPAGTDPGIKEPAPSTGSQIQVLPPPGAPGGRSDIQPK